MVLQVLKDVGAPTVVFGLDKIIDISKSWEVISKDEIKDLVGRSESHMIKQRKDHVGALRATRGVKVRDSRHIVTDRRIERCVEGWNRHLEEYSEGMGKGRIAVGGRK